MNVSHKTMWKNMEKIDLISVNVSISYVPVPFFISFLSFFIWFIWCIFSPFESSLFIISHRFRCADVCQSKLIMFELCAVYFISFDRCRLWLKVHQRNVKEKAFSTKWYISGFPLETFGYLLWKQWFLSISICFVNNKSIDQTADHERLK